MPLHLFAVNTSDLCVYYSFFDSHFNPFVLVGSHCNELSYTIIVGKSRLIGLYGVIYDYFMSLHSYTNPSESQQDFFLHSRFLPLMHMNLTGVML